MCFLSFAEASKRPPQPIKMQRRYSDVVFELAASGRSDVPVNKAQLGAESGPATTACLWLMSVRG